MIKLISQLIPESLQFANFNKFDETKNTISYVLTISFSFVHSQTLKISPLIDNFYPFTTYQDYRGTPFPANGMYLITGSGAVLFDTPWVTTQFQPLLDSIKARHNKEVVMAIATHSHDDRTAGLEYYTQEGIKTYTTALTDTISIAKGERRAEFLIYGDTSFTVGQYTFETYYPGAGHTLDNIVIWFPKQKILYGGCFIKSTQSKSLGNIADADVESWPASIRNVLNKFGQPEFVIPGHRSWEDKQSLEHTLRLLAE